MKKKQSPSNPSHNFSALCCRDADFVFYCITDNEKLIHLTFSEEAHRHAVSWLEQNYPDSPVGTNTQPEKFCRYFSGYLTGRTKSLPAAGASPFMKTATPFQASVWKVISQIPYGETRTYGQLAVQLNKKGAARAVGQACHKNPLALIIPCHRVVGCQGGLRGFAGGIAVKKRLLALEKK